MSEVTYSYAPSDDINTRGAGGVQQGVYRVPNYDVGGATSEGWAHGAPNATPSGCNAESLKRVFLSVHGSLRVIEFIFALVSFASMSRVDSYDEVSQFSFLIFATVTSWIFVLGIIPAHIFDVHSGYSWLYTVELALDGLFAFFTFIGGIVAAVKCDSDAPSHDRSFCEHDSNAKTAVGFCLVLSFFLMGSTFLSYRRYSSPPPSGMVAL